MSSLKNDKKLIIQIRENGYIIATKLFKNGGKKKLDNYYRNKQTKTFVEVLSKLLEIPEIELIESKQTIMVVYDSN